MCAGIGKKQLTGLRQLIDKLHAPTTSKSDSRSVEQEKKTEKRRETEWECEREWEV